VTIRSGTRGRLRGADSRQQRVRAAALRPASGSWSDTPERDCMWDFGTPDLEEGEDEE